MAINDELAEEIIKKYVKNEQILALGMSVHAEKFLRKLAFKIEEEGLKVKILPTSAHIAAISSSFNVPLATIAGHEVDVAIEFADLVDGNFNFIKRNSASLVRDKMIAQSAADMIVIAKKENFVKLLHGVIPFEISTFGWKRTLAQLDRLGEANLRRTKTKIRPFKTETRHYIVDVKVDNIYSLEDLDFQAKDIAGVLESGLFIDYADRVLLHNHGVEVKSRIRD